MRSQRQDRGQATVELALCLPLVCLLLLGVVQIAVVVRDQLAVVLAAREAARAAAASADPQGAGADAASRSIALRPLRVDVVDAGDTVTASVHHRAETSVPLIGALLPDIDLVGRATMAIEPP